MSTLNYVAALLRALADSNEPELMAYSLQFNRLHNALQVYALDSSAFGLVRTALEEFPEDLAEVLNYLLLAIAPLNSK